MFYCMLTCTAVTGDDFGCLVVVRPTLLPEPDERFEFFCQAARDPMQNTQQRRSLERQISPVGHACPPLSSPLVTMMTRWITLFLSFLCATAQDPTAAPTNQTEAWGGCINPDDPTASTLVTIGEPTAICLTIGQGGNWAAGVPYLRFIFTPKADVYSSFVIPNSFKDLINGSTNFQGLNLTVFTASQEILSFLRVYYDLEKGRVFPFLTAIIDVRDGVVAGIAWDNACVFCASDFCLENTYNFAGQLATDLKGQSKGCYLKKSACEALHKNGGTNCDIQLFVVWTGTDSTGRAFLSSANRFSAFPPGQIQDRVSNQINDFLDGFPDIPFTR